MVAAYAYYSAKNELNSPIPEAAAIVPSDTDDLFVVYRSIYVGSDTGLGSSDVKLITDGGTTLTFKNVPHGKILPITARRILATGTTATLILGLGQGIPSFVLSPNGFPAQLDIDFVNNQAWGGGQIVTPASLLTCTRASSGYYQNANGTLTNFLSNTLRTGTNGLLVEEARTNACLDSAFAFDTTTWSGDAATVSLTANSATGPDGLLSAATMTDNSGNSVHRRFQGGISYVNTQVQQYSCYVKAGTLSWVQLLASDGVTNFFCNFNVSLGTIGTSSGATGTITALANGWYRCNMSFTSGNTGVGNLQVCTLQGDTAIPAGPGYIGGTGTLLLFGAQLEQNVSFPTSYILTSAGGPATRAADNITTPLVMPTAYSMCVKTFNLLDAASTGNRLIGMDNGTLGIFVENFNNTQIASFTGSSLAATLGSGTLSGTVKWAIAGDTTGKSLVGNAGSIATDAVALTPTTIKICIGGNNGTNNVNGYIQRVTYWQYRLPNAALITVSTP